jgi:hypothetical protein
MNKLIQKIEEIQSKLEGFRQYSLNETSTRTKVINPLLDSLGWDVSDPEEVEEEYTTFDGKMVDYALKINNKPVLLVEAKAMDDPLTDNKSIGQVVGYAANAGIVWCVLTNGVKWQVYRSVEKCPAPDKMMFEVTLDPKESEGISTRQLAEKMWLFSREGMVKCTLDELGEQTFTDGKVRKALDAIMREPPKGFIKILRAAANDESLNNQKVKDSLFRIYTERRGLQRSIDAPSPGRTKLAPAPYREIRSRKGKKLGAKYDEHQHLSEKPKEVIELYQSLDRFCFSLAQGKVEKTIAKWYITYNIENTSFCSTLIKKNKLIIFLKLKYNRLDNPPSFSRDVSNIGHYGMGDLELVITSLSQLKEAEPLIRQSFEGQT